MNKQILFVASLALLVASCSISIKKYARRNGLKYEKVKNVSFFDGKVKSGNSSKEKDRNAWLLYRGDKLQYVATSPRMGKRDSLFKFQRLNDSLIMLTRAVERTIFARYDPVDTILFSNNICVNKRSFYDYGSRDERVCVSSHMQSYFLKNGTLIRKSEQDNDEVYIFPYFKKLVGTNSIGPAEILGNYSSLDSAKLDLFTRFFWY
jgi:hypothetical protein